MSDIARSQLSFISFAQQQPFTSSVWPWKRSLHTGSLSSSAVTFCRPVSSATRKLVARRRQGPRPTEPSNTTPCTGAGSTGEPGGWGVLLPPNKAGFGPSAADKGLGAATHSNSSYLTIHCSSTMGRGSSVQGK